MKAFGKFLRQDIYKMVRSRTFVIILLALTLLVLVDGVSAIGSYNNEMQATLSTPKDENGIYLEDPWIGIATLYNSWIGGRIGGVLPLLFYFLMPVFCVIPYSWSYLSEEKSGYIKLICSKIGKLQYAAVKYLSSFLSGFFIVVLPQLFSILFISCFVPAYAPEPIYALYHQVGFEKLWGNLFYTRPFLYMVLYILLSGIFGGIWATVCTAVSMFHKNRFVVLFSPFIVLMYLIYSADHALMYRARLTLSPLDFIRPTQQGQAEYPWVLLVELLLIAIPAFIIILWRGRKNDVF